MALQIVRIGYVFISMNGRLDFPMLCQKDPVCSLFLEPDLLCVGSQTVGLGSHKADDIQAGVDSPGGPADCGGSRVL